MTSPPAARAATTDSAPAPENGKSPVMIAKRNQRAAANLHWLDVQPGFLEVAGVLGDPNRQVGWRRGGAIE